MHEFNNQKPLYLQLKNIIENSILNGALKPNDAVPSIRVLAKDYCLNPLTVGSAINELVDSGVLYKKRGIGIFVSENASEIIKRLLYADFKDTELVVVLEKAKLLGFKKSEITTIINTIYGGKNDQ